MQLLYMIVGLTQKGKGENEALSGRTLRGRIKGVQSRRRQKGGSRGRVGTRGKDLVGSKKRAEGQKRKRIEEVSRNGLG